MGCLEGGGGRINIINVNGIKIVFLFFLFLKGRVTLTWEGVS